MKSFKQFRSSLSEAKMTTKQHIQNYTDLSRPLTHVLHRLHAAGKNVPAKIETEDQTFDIHALDDIAAKNKLTKSMELYSGVKHNPMDHIDEHGHLHFPAYTSTSELPSVARKFANTQALRQDNHETGEKRDAHIIRFNMKKGHRAGSLSSKSTYGPGSTLGDEKEWLLPRNTKVKIHPTPETSVDKEGRKFHIWNAHPVD